MYKKCFWNWKIIENSHYAETFRNCSWCMKYCVNKWALWGCNKGSIIKSVCSVARSDWNQPKVRFLEVQVKHKMLWFYSKNLARVYQLLKGKTRDWRYIYWNIDEDKSFYSLNIFGDEGLYWPWFLILQILNTGLKCIMVANFEK